MHLTITEHLEIPARCASRADNDCCTLNYCDSDRPFEMKILDNAGREVMHIVRPWRCSSCCFPCCLQEMEVHAPPGTLVGKVVQRWSLFEPDYEICDANGQPVLRLHGFFLLSRFLWLFIILTEK